jgi:hypothetical protein
VITCLDPRTDPSAFLGLELGDAMVIRNAGGRVSPDVLKDLAYIGYLSSTIVPGATPPSGDPTAHTYSSYPLPAEMTATGEIVDGMPHIHAVMAVQETGQSAGTCTGRSSAPRSPALM